jgi:hypothetical protein
MSTRSVYIVLFKNTATVKVYSSMKAIFLDNSREELGVSLSTVQKRDFSFDNYENEKIKIDWYPVRGTGTVRRELEQFL